jgi:hypothetical protein
MERIAAGKDKDELTCLCGNVSWNAGFQTCDASGNAVEPIIGGKWVNLLRCDACGRIINQDTLEVVGRCDLETVLLDWPQRS